MKSVQIPYDLFLDLAMYHLRGDDDFEEEIRQGLEQKLDAMMNRQLYSRYKTAPTEEEREQARQEYLDRRGVPQSYRWTTYSSLGAVTGACHAPVAGRQGNALTAIPVRSPSPSKNPQSLRWMWAGDYEQRLSANKLLTTLVFAVCVLTANRKTGRGFRRSRIPPRRAHDTLQPQDESIIVGYYTSAEVLPRKPPCLAKSEIRR